MNLISVSNLDLALAALLLLVNGATSLALGLGFGRQMAWAALRMVVQLGLMGLVLKALFVSLSPLWIGLAALVMVAFAGREISARQQRKFRRGWGYGLGVSAMVAGACIVTVFALTMQLRPDPWYAPRYSIPLLGMMLGNAMTGVSLGLDSLTTQASHRRDGIEAQLALGAPRFTAFRPLVRDALRSGMIPIINAMAGSGLVFLPGLMTGQILAGVPPEEAIRYQILIMFLIGGATGLGVILAVLGGARRLSDDRHRLRLDRLTAANGGAADGD